MQLTFDANADRLEREHNDRAWLAWHVAALSRAKKFPPLSSLKTKPAAEKAKTLDKRLEDLQRWVKSTGGKVIIKPRDALDG